MYNNVVLPYGRMARMGKGNGKAKRDDFIGNKKATYTLAIGYLRKTTRFIFELYIR